MNKCDSMLIRQVSFYDLPILLWASSKVFKLKMSSVMPLSTFSLRDFIKAAQEGRLIREVFESIDWFSFGDSICSFEGFLEVEMGVL